MGGNSERKVKPAQSTARPGKPIKRPAVRKSRPASRDDYWIQLAESIRAVGKGPTQKQLEDVRARIEAGEDEGRVADELLGQVLDANARMWKQRLKDLTDKPKKRHRNKAPS